MQDTTTILVELPAIADKKTGYSALAMNIYMQVDTTPTSITYNPRGNIPGNTPTYNIINLSFDPTFTSSNLINPVSGINQLFDLKNMCFVPSYDYTNDLHPSVEFYEIVDPNSNSNFYNYILTLNAPYGDTNWNSYFLLYGTQGNTSSNNFKQVGANSSVSITLSYYSPPLPPPPPPPVTTYEYTIELSYPVNSPNTIITTYNMSVDSNNNILSITNINGTSSNSYLMTSATYYGVGGSGMNFSFGNTTNQFNNTNQQFVNNTTGYYLSTVIYDSNLTTALQNAGVTASDNSQYAFSFGYIYVKNVGWSPSQVNYINTFLSNGNLSAQQISVAIKSQPPPTSTLGATCTLTSSGVDPATGTVVTASSSASATASGRTHKDALKALLEDVTIKLLLEGAVNFSTRNKNATHTLSVKLDK